MSFEIIIFNTIIDIGVFFSIFFGGALLLSQIQIICNQLIVNMIGYRGMMYTSFPGTITHETSHAFFALLFRHSIIRMRFFEPNLASGSLGYVEHKYNKLSTYQNLGNFFIGMAPLIGGSAVLFFFTHLLTGGGVQNPFLPNSRYNLEHSITLLHNIDLNLQYVIDNTLIVFEHFRRLSTTSPILSGMLLFISVSIAIHASPSRSDLHGAASGGIVIIFITFFINGLGLYFTSCCEDGVITKFYSLFKTSIIYSEVLMVNLLTFVIALSIIGLGSIFIGFVFVYTIRKISRIRI